MALRGSAKVTGYRNWPPTGLRFANTLPLFCAQSVQEKVMTFKPSDIRHEPILTDYDRACVPIYVLILDCKQAGQSWQHIAEQVWGDELPNNHRKLIKSHYQRAQWMTTDGYLQMIAENPTPRTETLDGLVASGRMSSQERAFLDGPKGEKWWPIAKH